MVSSRCAKTFRACSCTCPPCRSTVQGLHTDLPFPIHASVRGIHPVYALRHPLSSGVPFEHVPQHMGDIATSHLMASRHSRWAIPTLVHGCFVSRPPCEPVL